MARRGKPLTQAEIEQKLALPFDETLESDDPDDDFEDDIDGGDSSNDSDS